MRLSLLCAVVAAGLCVVAVAAPVPDLAKLTPDEQFGRFKQQFNKVYSSPEEENHRREVFKANLAQLSMSNDATVGVTKFSDLTDDEFAQRYLGLRPSKNLGNSRFWDSSCPACKRFPELAAAAPSSFDWTTKGAVTAVKTQNCGDCYAFASTGVRATAPRSHRPMLCTHLNKRCIGAAHQFLHLACEI